MGSAQPIASPLRQNLSVVIPLYNEEGAVSALIEEVRDALARDFNLEIVLVEDCSTDGTRALIESEAKKDPSITLVLHERNFGQSAAVYSGVAAAAHEMVATLDGDGQNPPAELHKLYERAASGNLQESLYVGCRAKREDGPWRLFQSRIANGVRRAMLHDDCPDSSSGMKLFAKSTFLQIPPFRNMHRFLPAMFKSVGCEIVNVPVQHRDRATGISKYNMASRLAAGLVDLFGVSWLIARKCNPKSKVMRHDD